MPNDQVDGIYIAHGPGVQVIRFPVCAFQEFFDSLNTKTGMGTAFIIVQDITHINRIPDLQKDLVIFYHNMYSDPALVLTLSYPVLECIFN